MRAHKFHWSGERFYPPCGNKLQCLSQKITESGSTVDRGCGGDAVSINALKMQCCDQYYNALFYVIQFSIIVVMYATECCGLLVARFECCLQCTVFLVYHGVSVVHLSVYFGCMHYTKNEYMHGRCMVCLPRLWCENIYYRQLHVRLAPAHVHYMTETCMSASAICGATCSASKCIVNVCNNTLLHSLNFIGFYIYTYD